MFELSSSAVLEGAIVPHCPTTPPDPQVVPAIKEDDDSVRFVYRRDEDVDGPVEISNDIALKKKECKIYSHVRWMKAKTS